MERCYVTVPFGSGSSVPGSGSDQHRHRISKDKVVGRRGFTVTSPGSRCTTGSRTPSYLL